MTGQERRAAVEDCFKLWQAIFEGRTTISWCAEGWRVGGVRGIVCRAASWQVVGGIFVTSNGWRSPSAIRSIIADLLPDRLDDLQVGLVELGFNLSEANRKTWHECGCAEERSSRGYEVRRRQRGALVYRTAAQFRPAPPPAGFTQDFQSPKWSSASPQWIRETLGCARMLTGSSARSKGLYAEFLRGLVAARGNERSVPIKRWLQEERDRDGLRSLVRDGACIAVHRRLFDYLVVLYGPSWRGTETLCSPEKSYTGHHLRTRYDTTKLAAEWAEPLERYGKYGLATHVARANWDRDARIAEKPPERDPNLSPERVLLDLAVGDVLHRSSNTNLPSLLVGGCAELFSWSSRAEDVRPEVWLEGVFDQPDSGLLKPGVKKERLFFDSALDLVMGMVDHDFKEHHALACADELNAVDSAVEPDHDGDQGFSEMEGGSGGSADQ